MYIPSKESLVLKLGKLDHKAKIFINKATLAEADVAAPNTQDGMLALAEVLDSPKLAEHTLSLIGRGATLVPEVVKALTEGLIGAFQYHGENFAEPKWQISLGFITDVDAKNAEYSKKRKGLKKPAAKAKKPSKTATLLS